jgi:cell division protein FtsZ
MAIHMSIPKDDFDLKPKITVIGVGGAGGNAVNNMIRANLQGIEFVVANADAQALAQSECPNRVQLGMNITRGLGAGSRPEIGKAAAEEALDEVIEYLHGSNMVFITAGMGGGTGTGAAPVIARVAREKGILTVGVVTKPFHFEGAHRMRLAEAGLDALQQVVDTLIVIPNQNLFRLANEKTTFADAFKMADDVLHSGVRGITDLMVMPGLVNLDFADIRTVMMEMGKAMMGTGEAEGENRAVTAAEAAISNPLLDDVSMKGARGVLINITGSKDMTLFEIDEAANRIREEVDADANIIFGSTFDDSVQGKIRISIVATGIDAAPRPAAKPIDHASRSPVSATPAQAPVGGGHAPNNYAPQHPAPHSAAAGGYPVAGQGVGMALQQPSSPYPHREFAEDVSGVFMTPPAVRADVRAEVVPPRLETVSAPEPIAAAPAVLVNPAPRAESPFVSPVSSAQTSSAARDASSSLPPLSDLGDASSSKPSLFGRLAQTVAGKPGKGEGAASSRPQPIDAAVEHQKQDISKSSPLPAVDEELEIPAFLRRK